MGEGITTDGKGPRQHGSDVLRACFTSRIQSTLQSELISIFDSTPRNSNTCRDEGQTVLAVRCQNKKARLIWVSLHVILPMKR